MSKSRFKFHFQKQGKYRAVRGWYDEQLQSTDQSHGRWYFRSLLEVACAKYLNLLIKCKEPIRWSYGRTEMENGHWDFNERSEKPHKTNSQYTLDFEVTNILTDHRYWIEVKGAPQGLTKIRRALKYFPERELRVFTARYGMEPAANYLKRLEIIRTYRKTEIPDLIKRIQKIREESKNE